MILYRDTCTSFVLTFTPRTLVSSTNKTDRHNITEIWVENHKPNQTILEKTSNQKVISNIDKCSILFGQFRNMNGKVLLI
jgi:hypothetical protein